MKKTISTEQTAANIAKVLAILTETPQKLVAFSERLAAGQAGNPLGAGERSFVEDVVHLLNSEARSAEIIYLTLLVDEPMVYDVHSEHELGKLLKFDQFELPSLLTYFQFRRMVLLRVLNGLSDAQWGRVVREEGKQRKESVYWRARSLALHEEAHVNDLKGKLDLVS
jgi:hypothetical protein